jgi:hypothetical protein
VEVITPIPKKRVIPCFTPFWKKLDVRRASIPKKERDAPLRGACGAEGGHLFWKTAERSLRSGGGLTKKAQNI